MRRGALIGIAAAAVLVVAGAVTAWVLTRPPGADSVADEYLHALSKGDFAAIDGLVAGGDGDAARLEQAFSGASGYISHYSVTLEGDTEGERTAHANVQLGGAAAVVDFVLTQRAGRWKVADYVASLVVTTTIGDSVRVGGVLVPAGTPIALLPAVYPVTAAPEGILAGESSVAVTNAAPATASLQPTLSADAVQLAQQRLDGYADGCAKRAEAVPANCGLRVPWAADLASLGSIAFHIDAYPVVTLSEDARTFDAVGGRIVATATGTTRAGRPGIFTYRTDEWALRGSVSFSGAEMELAVR